MKKSLVLLCGILLAALFSGCKIEPLMCTVSLEVNGHGTATVDKTNVPIGSIVTVTTNPDEGYCVNRVYTTNDTCKNPDSSNKYLCLVSEQACTIQVKFSEMDRRRIHFDSCSNGKINSEIEEAYYGKKVILTAVPEYGYVLKEDSLKVCDYWKDSTEYEVTKDPDDSSKFSFIMPDGPVTISAEFEQFLTFTNDSEKITVGDKASFTINNYSDFTKCNLYISYSDADKKELLQSNVDLTKEKYTFETTHAGTVTLFAKNPNKNDTYYQLTSFTVDIENLPENYTTVSCYLKGTEDDDEGSYIIRKASFYVTDFDYTKIRRYKYYYESNPTNVKESFTYDSSNVINISFEYSYFKDDAVVFQLYDASNQYISETVRIEIPAYPDEPEKQGERRD